MQNWHKQMYALEETKTINHLFISVMFSMVATSHLQL